jgi:hypothetical protein
LPSGRFVVEVVESSCIDDDVSNRDST